MAKGAEGISSILDPKDNWIKNYEFSASEMWKKGGEVGISIGPFRQDAHKKKFYASKSYFLIAIPQFFLCCFFYETSPAIVDTATKLPSSIPPGNVQQ